MANHLKGEKSPYLLQHEENPVDWHPWGEEALSRARREDKPILVSIGYSACHWCHVMAHESFEDRRVAEVMNEHFVNIKVDREERPDVDGIYMEAVQAMSGQGGWPLNVFLTPEGRPFFGGTYFPPAPRHGMPSWTQVLESVASAYRERREDVQQNAEILTSHILQAQNRPSPEGEMSPDILRAAFQSAVREFDWSHGGFGGAPKFPQPLALEFVLRMAHRFGDDQARDFVLFSLRSMADNGIFDQLGGGFHRYTVDGNWLVPHFEKMLYDNALLTRVYLQAYQVTGDRVFAVIAERTLDYVMRDLRSPEGGFYSAEDADSEGEEGKFYLWTLRELTEAIGPERAPAAAMRYGVTAAGNFEGKTILTAAASTEEVAESSELTVSQADNMLHSVRQELLAWRSRRVRPGVDTKILAGWNGLMIRALADAAAVLGRAEYGAAAEKAARFVLDDLRPDGVLMRSYRDGPSAIHAFLEDYAYLIEALITLYETVHDSTYLEQAESLAAEMKARFWDGSAGVFFDAEAGDDLVVRPRSYFDNPIPAGNSAAASALLRLEALTAKDAYRRQALPAFQAVHDLLPRAPLAFSYLLSALDFFLAPPLQIAIVGENNAEREALVGVVFQRYLANKVVAVGKGSYPSLLEGREEIGDSPTAYVCEDFACKLPVNSASELGMQLSRRSERGTAG